jgi:NAD(P)-dependent dehydrogenase (short-subunit alcohol dehydrogenase family)
MSGELSGKVALVTGASKHIGRGIALELGAAGATVWVAARTLGESDDEPGTLRSAAAEITASGGEGIAVQCDAGDDEALASVFAQIAERSGRLDVLVNNASPDFSSMVGKRFWDLPADDMTVCLDIGPRSAFVASQHAARMMIPQGSGLIVTVSSHGSREYILSVPYGAGKAAMDKLTHDTGLELQEHGVAVVSIWPGYVTEREPASATISAAVDRRFIEMALEHGETPRFSGRAVVALATDPGVMRWTANSVTTRRLAAEYGFTDVDGHQPPREMRVSRGTPSDDLPMLFRILSPWGDVIATAFE